MWGTSSLRLQIEQVGKTPVVNACGGNTFNCARESHGNLGRRSEREIERLEPGDSSRVANVERSHRRASRALHF